MQEQEGQDLQPESHEPMLESEPALESTPLEQAPEEAPVPGRRLRRALIWAVSLVIILAAGVILTWTLRVQPQAQQIATMKTDLTTIQEQLDVQGKELEELRPLLARNQVLEEQLSLANAHLDLLNVLVDVTTAQLALTQEDEIAARAALTGTGDRLSTLESTLEGANASAAAEMNDRLQLVLEEVETDSFAARRDLEILANNLLSLERVIFGE